MASRVLTLAGVRSGDAVTLDSRGRLVKTPAPAGRLEIIPEFRRPGPILTVPGEPEPARPLPGPCPSCKSSAPREAVATVEVAGPVVSVVQPRPAPSRPAGDSLVPNVNPQQVTVRREVQSALAPGSRPRVLAAGIFTVAALVAVVAWPKPKPKRKARAR